MIFLSYSSKDIEKAKVLSSALEKSGLSVWWDRQIPSGSTFDDVIEDALGKAQCVVVLWSSHSVKSEWVRNEVQDGVDRKIMIPVLIENVKIPLAFRRIQAANLIGWKGDTETKPFQDLINDIKTHTSQNGKRLDKTLETQTTKEPIEYISKKRQPSKATEKNINNSFQKLIDTKKFAIILSIIVLLIVAFIVYNSGIVNGKAVNKPQPGLVFASKIEANGQAIDSGTTFSQNINNLYAVFRSNMTPPGMLVNADSISDGKYYAYLKLTEMSSLSEFGWQWYRKSDGEKIVEYNPPTKDKKNFWLQRYGTIGKSVFSEFGPGTYTIVILLDGNPALSSDLTIEPSLKMSE
ncbi:toll/interleukin-1 receptor domain-containing protein [Psychroserpens burtonensis]|uniref:toll/interleukin-1 receptor domain-containing protein n=1 Tax=Psychroserpens burtonensis TaxID=49278 RepID=UPI00041BD7A8|nr:toll/interleukin-1 receptor domain-containing protein [Psychroserpens burtonensis]